MDSAAAVKYVLSSIETMLPDDPNDGPEPAGQENVAGKRVPFARKLRTSSNWIDSLTDVHEERDGKESNRKQGEEIGWIACAVLPQDDALP